MVWPPRDAKPSISVSSRLCKRRKAGTCLGGEDGEGHEHAEEAQADPVRGKLADAKVAQNEVQLVLQRQFGRPDVRRRLPPQLHGTARPPMLLFPVRKETGGQLRTRREQSVPKMQASNNSPPILHGY